MQADFDTTPRIFAFPVAELLRIGELVALYGSALPDTPKQANSQLTRSIAGGLDREGSTDLRSIKYPTTASATLLTDGRYASEGYWTLAVLDAVVSGDVLAEELTREQFQALTPQSLI